MVDLKNQSFLQSQMLSSGYPLKNTYAKNSVQTTARGRHSGSLNTGSNRNGKKVKSPTFTGGNMGSPAISQIAEGRSLRGVGSKVVLANH